MIETIYSCEECSKFSRIESDFIIVPAKLQIISTVNSQISPHRINHFCSISCKNFYESKNGKLEQWN